MKNQTQFTGRKKVLNALKDMIDNPTPRIPVGLLLDTSSSMQGDAIKELNLGVRQFLDEITKDPVTACSAETGIVTFSSEVDLISDFNYADRITFEDLTASGLTKLGEGLEKILDLLSDRKELYRTYSIEYYQPILVVMSDGSPNGDKAVLSAQINRIKELVGSRKLTVIAVGIGSEADMNMLSMLTPCSSPVRLRNLCFREFFMWLSDSVSGITDSYPGGEPELDIEELMRLESEEWSQKNL